MQVVLLFGISGACRCDELTNLNVADIEDKGAYLHISITATKTYKPRSFTIIKEGYPVDPLEIYRKYAALRPSHVLHGRFFLNYKKEKCTAQPVGINTISGIPRVVAIFLNLPQSQLYTGHCFRRSSATILVNSGGDLVTLKRHGGWKSSNVAEGYIEDSISQKIETAKKIQGVTSSSDGCTSSSYVSVTHSTGIDLIRDTIQQSSADGINFHGNVGTVNIYIHQKE